MTVTVPAEDPSTATGRVVFDTPAQAARFMRAIPPRIARAKKSLVLRFLGVTDLLDALKLQAKGKEVTASVTLTAAQVKALLEMVRGMIPQVRVPGMPPRLPPDAGPTTAPRGSAKPDQPKPDAGPALRLPSWH
jgi:hypothetical protein